MSLSISEDQILKDLAAGNKEAIESVYRGCYKSIETLIINNNGSPDDAKDIFQEAMIVLYENARSGSFKLSCQVKTYLYAVSKRLWLKRLAEQARYTNDIDGFDAEVDVREDMEIYHARNAELMVMERAIRQIGEPCKGLLEAFYFGKKTMPEIAEQFGYTNADNAKNQKYKCLIRLKKIFFIEYKTTV